MTQRRPIVGTLTQFSMSHHFAGKWRPDAETPGNRGYMDIDTWIEVVKISGNSKIDCSMWANSLGQGGYLDGDLRTASRSTTPSRDPHQVEPPPQGPPVFFQAGISGEDTRYAALHAEVPFIGSAAHPEVTHDPREWVTRGREQAEEARPGTVRDFAEMIAPELRKRSPIQNENQPGRLRQKLLGGNLLPDHHSAARHRPDDPEDDRRSVDDAELAERERLATAGMKKD